MICLDKIIAFLDNTREVRTIDGRNLTMRDKESYSSLKKRFKEKKKKEELLETTLSIIQSNPVIDTKEAVEKAKELIKLVNLESS